VWRQLLALLGCLGSIALTAQTAREPDWARLEEETMRHFQAVLRLDTSNPPGNEVLVTDYVKGILEKEGIPVQIFASDPKRPNLVARLKATDASSPFSIWATATWSPSIRKSGPFRRSVRPAKGDMFTAVDRSTTSLMSLRD